MGNKQLINFKTRFDTKLYNQIIKFAKYKQTPVYKFIQKALIQFFNDYKNGIAYINKMSYFIKRENMQKKEYYAIFNYELKEKLRRYSFTFSKSQAEVLRIALEYYIYILENKNLANHQQKNRHDETNPTIGLVIYELFTTKIRMIKNTKSCKIQFF